jgi:hypothetical protein
LLPRLRHGQSAGEQAEGRYHKPLGGTRFTEYGLPTNKERAANAGRIITTVAVATSGR